MTKWLRSKEEIIEQEQIGANLEEAAKKTRSSGMTKTGNQDDQGSGP